MTTDFERILTPLSLLPPHLHPPLRKTHLHQQLGHHYKGVAHYTVLDGEKAVKEVVVIGVRNEDLGPHQSPKKIKPPPSTYLPRSLRGAPPGKPWGQAGLQHDKNGNQVEVSHARLVYGDPWYCFKLTASPKTQPMLHRVMKGHGSSTPFFDIIATAGNKTQLFMQMLGALHDVIEPACKVELNLHSIFRGIEQSKSYFAFTHPAFSTTKSHVDGVKVRAMCMDFSPSAAAAKSQARGTRANVRVMGGGYLQVVLGTYMKDISGTWRAQCNERGDIPYKVKSIEVAESAHRLLLWMFAGPPADPTHVVMHTCGNRRCLCVAHLYYGRQRDNVRNKLGKSRAARTALLDARNAAREKSNNQNKRGGSSQHADADFVCDTTNCSSESDED